MHRLVLAALAMLLPALAAARAEEWKDVAAAAKREGEVVVYNAVAGAEYKAVVSAFEKRYGVRVRTVDVGSGELAGRLRTEQAAGRFLGDVVQQEQPMLPDPATLQPHGSLPDAGKLRPPFKVTDIAVPSSVQAYGILVNGGVAAKERPTGWHSLLEARWTGKILAGDMRATGGGAVMFAVFQDAFGEDFNVALAKQKPTLGRDTRDDERRVAQGEFPIYIPARIASPKDLAGRPVVFVVPEEGCPYVEIDGAMLKNAPHPNAARLLLDWLVGPDAQLARARGGEIPVTQDALDRAPPDLAPKLQCKLLGTPAPDKINAYSDLAKDLYK